MDDLPDLKRTTETPTYSQTPSPFPKAVNRFFLVIGHLFMTAIFLFVMLVWFFVGLFFWLPIMLRATTIYTIGMILMAAFGKTLVDLNYVLNSAILFFPNGFKTIWANSPILSQPDAMAEGLQVNDFRFFDIEWKTLFSSKGGQQLLRGHTTMRQLYMWSMP